MGKPDFQAPKGLPLLIDLSETFPGSTDLRFNLMRSMIRQKLYEEALEQVSVFLQLRIQLFRAYLAVSEIYAHMGKHRQSLSWLRLALTEGYQDPQIYDQISYNYKCLNEPQAAENAQAKATAAREARQGKVEG